MSLDKAMLDMYDETGLESRKGTYYFRMKKPADLRVHLTGGADVRESLRTKDKATAKRLCAERRAALLREWNQLRERLRNGPRRNMGTEERRQVIAHCEARLLQWDEEDRIKGLAVLDDEIPHDCLWEDVDARDRAAVARGQFSPGLRMAAEDWLRECGYELAEDSEDYRYFVYEFARMSRRLHEAYRRRSDGEDVATPAIPAPPAARMDEPSQPTEQGKQRTGPVLRDALPIWQRLKKPAPSSVEIYESALTRFEQQNPGLAVPEITKRHIRDHIEFLQSEGKSAKTIEKEHGALRALLTVAEHEDWVTSNPAKGVLLPSIESSKTRSYTPDEVSAIFAAPVFTASERPIGGKGEAAYWVPLVLLFTGARREEVCQLKLDHIRESDGVHFFAIDPRDDFGRLKTDESRRAVPIHPTLEKLGFLNYVAERRAEGGKLLFPLLDKPNKRGQVGAKWGDWWCRYVRKVVGLTDKRLQPAHAFRHLFITECRRLNFREDYERRLVGHAANSARKTPHDDYGEHLVTALATEVARIDFRGLDLSHLYDNS
jgi:integrase